MGWKVGRVPIDYGIMLVLRSLGWFSSVGLFVGAGLSVLGGCGDDDAAGSSSSSSSSSSSGGGSSSGSSSSSSSSSTGGTSTSSGSPATGDTRFNVGTDNSNIGLKTFGTPTGECSEQGNAMTCDFKDDANTKAWFVFKMPLDYAENGEDYPIKELPGSPDRGAIITVYKAVGEVGLQQWIGKGGGHVITEKIVDENGVRTFTFKVTGASVKATTNVYGGEPGTGEFTIEGQGKAKFKK